MSSILKRNTVTRERIKGKRKNLPTTKEEMILKREKIFLN